MESELRNFSIPNKLEDGKALVYFIYRNDQDTLEKALGLMPDAKIYAAASTDGKVTKHNNQATHLANIFTLGALREAPNPEKDFLGAVGPGQFLAVNVDPGAHEFTRELINAKEGLLGGRPAHLNLAANQTHYIILKPGSFLNRYSASMESGIFMNKAADDLTGQYVLMKNFIESKPGGH